LISCDADVADAVHLARKEGQTRVKLLVQDQKTLSSTENLAIISPSDDEVESPIEPKSVEMPILPTSKTATTKRSGKKSSSQQPQQQQTSNPLLLPAAIGFLGVVITGVFVYSRVQQKSN
jgi:hypothetical protein